MEKHRDIKKILFTHNKIVKRVKELAAWVNAEYKDNELVIAVILKGAMPFAAELIKHIKVDHILDFMVISSYDGLNSTGQFKVVLDLNESIKNKRVLIVEDIVETGNTLKNLKKLLKTRKPKDIKIMTLLSKDELHDKKLKADQIGFNVGMEFVVGYGLDYNDRYRNLPYIGIFNEKYL